MFFKVMCWPVVCFNWLPFQVHNEKAIIIINNLLINLIRLVITGKSRLDGFTSLSLSQYLKASVWDFPVMTSLPIDKWYMYVLK